MIGLRGTGTHFCRWGSGIRDQPACSEQIVGREQQILGHEITEEDSWESQQITHVPPSALSRVAKLVVEI